MGLTVLLQKLLTPSILIKSRLPSVSLRSVRLSEYLNFTALRMSSTLSESFEDAKAKLNTLKDEPGNDIKLKLYGLFKQATIGPCNIPKPGVLDYVGKAKWEAWNSLGSISQDEAKQKYISFVNSLLPVNTSNSGSDSTDNISKYEGLLYFAENEITKIIFNRPQKKNAITSQMYQDIISALKNAAENDTAITVITGNGDYYSSGNDLTNFSAVEGDIDTMARKGADLLKAFVAAFIDFPKPLIAAVNGPAVGIPVTLLGLFDIIYASDKATFQTPFSVLGQSPEGCSTYTFPKIMGYAKANEMLLFNKKITAEEAKQVGLVNEVFPDSTFQDEVLNRLKHATKLSKNSMIYSKKLSRDIEREILHKVNSEECDRLVERWQSPDCMNALMQFFQKKAKL